MGIVKYLNISTFVPSANVPVPAVVVFSHLNPNDVKNFAPIPLHTEDVVPVSYNADIFWFEIIAFMYGLLSNGFLS